MKKDSKKIIKIILIIIFAPILLLLIDSITGDVKASEPSNPKIEVVEEEDHNIEAFVYCQQTVEANLKSPSTAEHPYMSDISITKEGNFYIINGFVDSQNSYGAMLRTNYYCKLKYENGIFSAEEFYFK
jgi:hypothetical protein